MDALSKAHEQHTAAGNSPQEPAHRVDVRPATRQDLAAVLALLEANQLPTMGVREHFQHFLMAYEGYVRDRYCWRTHFNSQADVSTRDVPGSSRFKEAVDGVKFTAFRSSPTVSGYV